MKNTKTPPAKEIVSVKSPVAKAVSSVASSLESRAGMTDAAKGASPVMKETKIAANAPAGKSAGAMKVKNPALAVAKTAVSVPFVAATPVVPVKSNGSKPHNASTISQSKPTEESAHTSVAKVVENPPPVAPTPAAAMTMPRPVASAAPPTNAPSPFDTGLQVAPGQTIPPHVAPIQSALPQVAPTQSVPAQVTPRPTHLSSDASSESQKVSEPPMDVEPPRVVSPVDILQQRAKSDVSPFRDLDESGPPKKSSGSLDDEPADSSDLQPPLLFEVAWEVCWQLGGIYTVLRSKASCMLSDWGDRYFLIGPYNPATAAVEFEEQPAEGSLKEALDRLEQWSHVKAHFGRWLIPGRPRVILLEHRNRYSQLDQDKYLMWKDHGITIPPGDGEVNDVVAFGFSVSEFFRHFTDVVKDRAILAHFHEWMGGVAVPRIAHTNLPVITVFTTHATLLGRYLAGDNPYFYDHLAFFDGDKEAAKYQILPRHQIEKAAAHASTVFTTVSEVTAIEADKLLGRKPDVIVPNGLNIHRFAAIHEFQNLHLRYKERIHDFVMGHFFPSYTFDLDRTLYFFTAGRYEYKNKGFDMFIEALAQLNGRLKQMTDPPTIVAFLVTRAPSRNINVDVLRSQMQFDELRNTCADLKEHIGARLFKAVAQGRIPGANDYLTEDAKAWLKRAIHAWRSNRQPPIVTHDLHNDAGDAILQHMRHRGLLNGADDPVKVIFHPEFVTATSPLIHLDYEQFVRGCHLGVFPSYYEPWGYTPLESIALGVPAVTTDLSGFGAYVEKHLEKSDERGVVVLKRRERSFDDTLGQLLNYLFQFVQSTRRQRIDLRNRVEQTSEMFDWSKLIVHYREAHQLALSRRGAGRIGKVEVRMV